MSSLPPSSQADPPNSRAWEQHSEMLRQHQSVSSLPPSSQADPPNSRALEQHREMLRQHQSMPSLPTRSRADQPNSGAWEQHKETLRQLYLLQGKPLKQVIKIMRQEHDFEATDKMYKYHFHRWKFRKNLTKEESRKHEADAVAGRVVVLPKSNGRQLGSQRLRTRIQKSVTPDVANKIVELTRHPMQHTPRIFIPDAVRHFEHAFVAIEGHSRARSRNVPNYYQDNTAAESWAARMRLAAHGISTEQNVKSNYRILSKSAAKFSSVLQKQEPILVWSTFTVIIELLWLNPRLGLAFIRVVAEFCSHLPNADPLKVLWAAMLQIDPGNIPDIIARLTAAQIEFFRREIGANNQFVLNYIRTSAKHLHDRGLLARHLAHEQMDEVISTLRSILNSGLENSTSVADRLIAACLFKACLHIDDKEYQEVEMILDEVDPGVDLANGMSKPQLVNFYEITAEMRLKRGKQVRGDYEASEQFYWKALTTAQQHLAKELPTRIGYCFIALGNYYAAMGNTEAVERVRALYEEHIAQMADDVGQHPPFDVAMVNDTRKFETGRHLELEKAYRREVEEVLQSRASKDRMGHVADALSHLGPGQHTIDVEVRWELSDFLSQGLDNVQDLATVMTITGEPAKSHVSSCEGYIKATWSNNSCVIEFFENLLKSSLDFSSTPVIFSSNEMSVSVATIHETLASNRDALNFQMTGTKDHIVGVCQCILWLATVCRPPKNGSVHTSRATFEMAAVDRFVVEAKPLRPLPPLDTATPIGCCWIDMFDGGYVLARGFPTPPRRCGRGIEIPFEIMVEQAMTYHVISHTSNGQDCLILKGSHTALVPVYVDGLESIDRTNEIQWHLIGRKPKLTPIGASTDRDDNENLALTDMEFSKDDPELSWEYIDQRGLKIYPIRRIQDVARKRSFVGHFPRAQILVGTDKEVYHELPEGPKAKPVQGNVIKFGQAMTLNFGSNAATGGLLTMSASATIKRSKYDPVPKQVKALIGDKLRRDCNKPHILYDIRTRIAWMIPEACVVLYLIHYWATLQTDINPSSEQTDHQQLSSSIRKLMPFIRPTSDGGRDAALAIWKAFQDLKELPKQIRFFDEPNNSVSVVDIIRNMYLAIDTLIEHQKRKKPGLFNRLLSRPELWGYDLADVAGFSEAPVKRVSVDKEQCGGWYELTNPDNRIVVLFGNNFGELIKYEAGQMICHQWKSVPPLHDFLFADSGTLEYLQDFDRRGRPSIFLSDRFSSLSIHGLGHCKERAWPCCNMTLQLTLSQPEVIIQVDKGKAVAIGRVNGAGSTSAYRRVYGPAIGKREARADESSAQERLKVPRLDHSNGSFTSPGACAHCSGASHLGNGSNSGNSSPETERDMAAGSETSNTATPQSGYTGSSY